MAYCAVPCESHDEEMLFTAITLTNLVVNELTARIRLGCTRFNTRSLLAFGAIDGIDVGHFSFNSNTFVSPDTIWLSFQQHVFAISSQVHKAPVGRPCEPELNCLYLC